MNKILLKAMSVVALFAAGTTAAWADEAQAVVKMTYVNGTDGSTTVAGGEVTTAKVGFLKFSGNQLALANKGWGENNIVYLQVDASAITGNIVKATLSAELSANNRRGLVYGAGYNSSTWSSSLTWDTADRTITTVGQTVSVATNKPITGTFDITDAFANDDDKVATILMYQTSAGGGTITNPTVTITYSTAAIATYTVVFKDGDGNIVKSEERKTSVGEHPTLKDADKEAFFADDEQTKRYLYESDDFSTVTVAESGTVATVTLKAAKQYIFTAISEGYDDGVSLPYYYEGTCWEDLNTISVPFPRYQLKGSTLYQKKANSNNYHETVTITQNLDMQFLEYSTVSEDGVFYTEIENVEGCSSSGANNHSIRCSNGLGGYNATDADIVLTTLDAGSYEITSAARSSSSKNTTPLVIMVGDTEMLSMLSTGSVAESSAQFTITEPTKVILPVQGGDNNVLDYVLIKKSTPTAISAVETAADNAASYNLAGQRVSDSYKGIVIRGGKKYVK